MKWTRPHRNNNHKTKQYESQIWRSELRWFRWKQLHVAELKPPAAESRFQVSSRWTPVWSSRSCAVSVITHSKLGHLSSFITLNEPGVTVRWGGRDVSTQVNQRLIRIVQGHLELSQYVIGHTHLHQSIWPFRFWFILTCWARLLDLVRICPRGFEVHGFGIGGAPTGQAQDASFPKHGLKVRTKVYDDWTNS